MKTTIEEQLKEVRREIGMRRRVYARQVSEGRMGQLTMDERIAVMEDIASKLQKESEFDLFDEEEAWVRACDIGRAIAEGDRQRAVNLVRGITDDSNRG